MIVINIERTYRTLEELAKQQNTTVEKIIAEIDECIQDAIATVKNNHDLQAMKKWKKIPSVGEIPTAVEFVTYLGEELIKDKMGNGKLVQITSKYIVRE